MEAYTGFAEVYDEFMDNIPYEDWCRAVTDILKKAGIKDGLVLELGCGTGTFTRLLAGEGYDMIGLDSAEDMLSIAMEKEGEHPKGILYLLQDMEDMELYGTVRAIVSVCDSMNYLTADGALQRVCALANNYLDPRGLFVFDLNTVYKYETLLGDQTIAEAREDNAFIWENTYDPESRLNEYALTIFCRGSDGRYDREEEFHYQRAYSMEEIRSAVESAGMELLDIVDVNTGEPPKEDCERIYVIAREKGKDREK